MSRPDKNEVLVVGAGPVGMLTAVLLAEEGIEVRVIDKEYRTATHSYACVLHPGTLQLLDRLGLAEEVCRLGRPVDTVAFYDGATRRAEIKLSELPGDFRYALVLPQSAFENVLERRLLARTGIKVLWNHRLSDLRLENDSVTVAVDKLAQTAKGYIVADWDWSVEKKLEATAAFVVGADGYDSIVRSRLGIEYERLTGPEQFAVFEFSTDDHPGNEARVVLDNGATSVLWPLPGHRCRWSFQLLKSTGPGQFPAKDRESVRFVQHEADEQIRNAMERLARKRAPWFTGSVNDIEWSGRVRFEHRLAKQFGKGRVWLAGDAAHQTGPVGVQSMNVGLLEADDLARTFKKILREDASPELLKNYDRFHRFQWAQLLGRGGELEATSADPWIRERAARLLSCVPASGETFSQLMVQLGFEPETAATLP